LSKNSIGACSEKTLDFKVLFYGSEKDFDFPASFINICNCLGVVFKIIG